MIIKDRKKLITFEADVLHALEAFSRRTGSSLRTILRDDRELGRRSMLAVNFTSSE